MRRALPAIVTIALASRADAAALATDHIREPSPWMMILLVAGMYLAIPACFGIPLLVGIRMLRRYRPPPPDARGEPVSLLVVEAAARTARRTNLVLLVAIAAATAGIITLTDLPGLPIAFAPLLVPVFKGLHVSSAMFRAARGDLAAGIVGSTIVVTDRKRVHAFVLTPREARAARALAVPGAHAR